MCVSVSVLWVWFLHHCSRLHVHITLFFVFSDFCFLSFYLSLGCHLICSSYRMSSTKGNLPILVRWPSPSKYQKHKKTQKCPKQPHTKNHPTQPPLLPAVWTHVNVMSWHISAPVMTCQPPWPQQTSQVIMSSDSHATPATGRALLLLQPLRRVYRPGADVSHLLICAPSLFTRRDVSDIILLSSSLPLPLKSSLSLFLSPRSHWCCEMRAS